MICIRVCIWATKCQLSIIRARRDRAVGHGMVKIGEEGVADLNGIDWIHNGMFLETALARRVLFLPRIGGLGYGYIPQCRQKRPRPYSGSGRSWAAGTHSW